MGLEPRGRADQGQPEANPSGEEPRERPKPKVKSFEIDKRLVFEAWEKVRSNKGAPGVDAVSVEAFEAQLKDNLYKLWNRMSSGSYFPGPVRRGDTERSWGGTAFARCADGARKPRGRVVCVRIRNRSSPSLIRFIRWPVSD
jgi:RNA-directed DNA polymerase